jgi:DNA-directed RNA polymerase II subunit RPB1
VVEVTKYEKSEIYKEGGLCDLSLGVNKNFEKCAKCSESIECPGHFGRIKLAKPVFHMGYVETIAKILKCICLKCSRLRRCDEKTKKKLKHI